MILDASCHICNGSQEIEVCDICKKPVCWVHVSSKYDKTEKCWRRICEECEDTSSYRFGGSEDEDNDLSYEKLINKINSGQRTFDEDEIKIILQSLNK